ncbi:MAG: hypothetical protein DRJ42_16840 [Deltaproteobacteria bacterium]|nr:MAG: hypothetical protein DRJ42_16840 [Deltaproteobacteria bacterium]
MAFTAILVACSGSHTGADAGPDGATDGSSCPELLETGCFEFSGACCAPADGPTCVDGEWTCPAGAVLTHPSCVTRCGEPDAGTDAMVDAAAPPRGEPPAACDYLCGFPNGGGRVREVTVSPLANPISRFGTRNVSISPGVQTRFGTSFSIVSNDCCMMGGGDQSASILHVDAAGPTTEMIFGLEPRASIARTPSIFFVDGRPSLLHTNANYTEVAVIDEETLSTVETLDVSALDLGATPVMTPSFVTRDGGLLVLQGAEVRLRRLDETLAPVGDAIPLGFTSRAGALVRTCGGGIIALFESSGVLYRLRIGSDGMPLEAAPVMVSTDIGFIFGRGFHAIWDGGHVVFTAEERVVELDADGNNAGETPVGRSVLAAVGTAEGLVILEQDGTEGVPEIVLRERITGAQIRHLGTLDVDWYGADAGMGLDDGRLDIVSTSFLIRDRVRTRSFECDMFVAP